MMALTGVPAIEASDMQATILRPRPSPYKGEHIVLRIDEAAQGREMLRRIIPHVAPAVDWWGTKYSGLVGYCFHLSRTQGTRTYEGVFG